MLKRMFIVTTILWIAGAAAADGPEIAPAGPCAEPRALARESEPERFEIAGNPASRLLPTAVSLGAGAGAPGGAPGAPPPPVPAAPAAGLCDSPTGCAAPSGPAFVESPPVTSLPPGLP